jgi:hypothetical protein
MALHAPDPTDNSESLTSRLADALRSNTAESNGFATTPLVPDTTADQGLFDTGLFDVITPAPAPAPVPAPALAPTQSPAAGPGELPARAPGQSRVPSFAQTGTANVFVEAEQQNTISANSRTVFASGPAVEQSPNLPEQQKKRLGMNSIKKFAVPEETPRQRARMRRPTSAPEPELTVAPPVNPSELPPPIQRPGFSVNPPVEVNQSPSNMTPFGSSPEALSPKAAQKAAIKAAKAADKARRNITPTEILDQRAPGKAREDKPFLLPLIPATLVTALLTYLWFQGAFRLLSLLPLFPIVIGTIVGGIMRMGTRTVDFARVIFAIILTTVATFYGHAAIVGHGPLSDISKTTIRWGDLPRATDIANMVSVFHDAGEKSLATASIMFAGLIAAGLISSLSAK